MMLSSKVFRLIHDIRFTIPIISHTKYFHHEFKNPEPLKPKDDTKQKVPSDVRHKYKVFRDEDSPEIFDVEEEKERYHIEDEPELDTSEEFLGLNLKHGVHGVFDVEDLVDVLRLENAEDIFVCSVPKEYKYVDYMVVVTGRSYRHMLATAEFVRRVFKKKCFAGENLPKIEGEKSRDWMAMDLGNIALHIFSAQAREHYDLESLWSIGSQYDKESNKPQDPLIELFEKHSNLLNNLKP
ncbi:mitochondrial assembly of ribosomal large subunit protein 1 [Episyrphus balteatus]|uniref:mitochondrial assembly of ribosomal large subunit protein 1 n=1 Tax=Episyrphus balteatus TaxID=286459 RepID=UPI002486A866|nr:mitochondrial assembly of ribosomal large subunit protein 1 [Episyrphus balteatus]